MLLGFFLHVAYIILCVVVICLIVQVGYFLKTKKKMTKSHLMSVYTLLVYLALVYMRTGVGTLWSMRAANSLIRLEEINLIPLFIPSAEFGVHVFDVLNVIMLVPLGFLLPLIWPTFRSLKKVAVTGFLFSLTIEISQLWPHRVTDINDLLMNTLGAVLGYVLYKVFFKKEKEKPSYFKHEPVIYLICSFIGVFLFYHPVFLRAFLRQF